MSDRPRILFGLGLGLVGLALPVWWPLAAGRSAAAPELELPAGRSACVEDARWMRAHHMELLARWRDQVVREGQRFYVSKTSGERHEMSLTKTCLGCHTSQERFCGACHDYVNVRSRLDCWGCHVDPKAR